MLEGDELWSQHSGGDRHDSNENYMKGIFLKESDELIVESFIQSMRRDCRRENAESGRPLILVRGAASRLEYLGRRDSAVQVTYKLQFRRIFRSNEHNVTASVAIALLSNKSETEVEEDIICINYNCTG